MFLKPELICADGVELRRAVFEPPRGEHDIYMLVLPGVERTCVPLVHVEPLLKASFDLGKVALFDLHRLEQNGPAMQALRAHPQSLIAAVRLKDGSMQAGVPEVLTVHRSRLLLRSAGLLATAAMGVFLNSLVASAFALILAGHQLRKALLIPARPRRGLLACREYG
jgi:hypothetical protein